MRALRVVAAPNALKGSLSAIDAASAIARGVHRASPSAHVIELPVADGGDGTREVLVANLGGSERRLTVNDPLGRPISAAYGVIDSLGIGVIDVATASGLALLTPEERDPMRASSYGTGQLLRALLVENHRKLWIGVGGSATVDGGSGLLAALGARFLDASGQEIAPGGAGLEKLERLDLSGLMPELAGAEIIVLSDVESELVGERGAALLFAPQKGADPPITLRLERALERLGSLLLVETGIDLRAMPRAGAAGGIAGTLHAVLGAKLVPGIDCVLDALGFDAQVRGSDLVITAEGRLDTQSLHNKGPFGVARRARHLGVRTLALAGSIASDFDAASAPFVASFGICRAPLPFARAREHAAEWLAATAEQAVRLFTSV